MKQWFRRQRTRQPKLAEYQRTFMHFLYYIARLVMTGMTERREQMAGELMSQLQDVLPRRPRPYERSPKSFKELTQWLEAPNASSLTFLRDVAAGTYTRIGLIPRDVAPLISHQAGNIVRSSARPSERILMPLLRSLHPDMCDHSRFPLFD